MARINTTVDWESKRGPGYEPLGVDLPRNFLEGDPNHVCLSIALMCMQPEPQRVKRRPQALAMLALYAAEAAVTYTRRQYRRLERAVLRYMEDVGDVDYAGTNNHAYAKFVLGRAELRAKREVIIGGGAVNMRCSHKVVGDGESARCAHCPEDLGWFCEESPDHACHYHTNEKGLVVLVDGKEVEPPADHSVDSETSDCCIYCGLPEERK